MYSKINYYFIGINKDAGYYIFSPRADLHESAAILAMNHTTYFFNQIRTYIGDNEFSKFLRLKEKNGLLHKIGKFINIC